MAPRNRILIGLLFSWSCLLAQEKGEKTVTREEFEKSLRYRTGQVELPGGMASLNLGPEFRFLASEDARRVLEGAWGNPPDESVLGMIFPSQLSPLAEGGWGVVITYDEDGLVKDDEAAKIDYGQLIATMKKETAESNQTRIKQGYPSIELIGWAAPPRYDAAAKKLYWAKELRFGGGGETTINYDIRALGRRGVLVLNAVAGKSQLALVEREIPKLLPMIAFNQGHRYSDFIPGKDNVAAYGIGALVAGKLAAKVGLFKWLIALLIGFKKLIPLALVAAAGGIKALLGRKKKTGEEIAQEIPPASPAA